MFKFAFAAARPQEKIVHGSQRPGYSATRVGQGMVDEWITFMKQRGIQRVCCLLGNDQLAYYTSDLLKQYREAFGPANVRSAPVKDYHLCDRKTLEKMILPFLNESDTAGAPTLVHCSGGIGRTGHVLAAWLVRCRGLNLDDALSSVVESGRNPYEAVHAGNATKAQLYALLRAASN